MTRNLEVFSKTSSDEETKGERQEGRQIERKTGREEDIQGGRSTERQQRREDWGRIEVYIGQSFVRTDDRSGDGLDISATHLTIARVMEDLSVFFRPFVRVLPSVCVRVPSTSCPSASFPSSVSVLSSARDGVAESTQGPMLLSSCAAYMFTRWGDIVDGEGRGWIVIWGRMALKCLSEGWWWLLPLKRQTHRVQ